MPYVVTSPCIDVKDTACLDECPVDAIYEGDRKLYINPNECTECGACASACPIGAIMLDLEVPKAERPFVKSEKEFFTKVLPGRDEPLGDPGGAKTVGKIKADTPFVAEYEASA
ncbi:4Fe-4S binding protein [Frankia sp. Mgl5]|uniref:Ferredoxin n=2 Tax=Frankiaceae TaxID=74712 RepID=A0A1S1PFD1_9ACTN|nr:MULTISPECIES: ferredoxin [Frankiaceae]AAD17275.1 ferredoxin I [Frankia sp. EuIK1]ABW16199.1 4Fe-4S ferredoxin iron-sulfur binding domain protein [Frankia sp. EAN1pec]MCK9929168.1 4Fe-4S binding protein [Frankia sp. Mgl5]OHV19655.1 (4Fe-4S)-binding protein [Parafrankia soli]TCJ32869.1 (4Fe-4S)-binding protein [Parafrankia sp. BMG5.11]